MFFQELAVSQEYLKAWIYYMFWLLFWVEACLFFFLLFWQFALELKIVFRIKRDFLSSAWRIFSMLLFFLFFALSTNALLHHRLRINPGVYWNMGMVAERNGADWKALRFFRKAEEAGESAPLFYIDYAEILHQTGKEKEALAKLKSSAGDSVMKELVSGKIYYAMGRYNDARKILEKAARQQPKNLLVQAWLGEDYIKLKQMDKARNAFTAMLKNPALPQPMRKKVMQRLDELKN